MLSRLVVSQHQVKHRSGQAQQMSYFLRSGACYGGWKLDWWRGMNSNTCPGAHTGTYVQVVAVQQLVEDNYNARIMHTLVLNSDQGAMTELAAMDCASSKSS